MGVGERAPPARVHLVPAARRARRSARSRAATGASATGAPAQTWDRTSVGAREARRCHHRKPTTIEPIDFLARVRGEACDSATLYALGAAFANDTRVVVATYEAFRADAGAELTRVFRELGLDASVARKTPPQDHETVARRPCHASSRTTSDLARALTALGAGEPPPRWNDPGHEGDAPVPLQRGARVRPLQGAGARVPGGRGVFVFCTFTSRGERTRQQHFTSAEHRRGRIGTCHCRFLVGTPSLPH